MLEFVNGVSWLGSGLPCPALVAYGGTRGPGDTHSPACGSDGPRADFFSLQAICSLAHGDT